ncbi:MAG: 50S ribosomal protein L10, partial [Chthoniobacterales bacterium]
MRPEKASIVSDLSEKLNRSPFLLVTDYKQMKVDQFGELRNRLAPAGAEVRVVKAGRHAGHDRQHHAQLAAGGGRAQRVAPPRPQRSGNALTWPARASRRSRTCMSSGRRSCRACCSPACCPAA